MDAVVGKDTCKHTGTMDGTRAHIRPIHAHGKATEDQSSMTSLRSPKPAIYKLTFMKPERWKSEVTCWPKRRGTMTGLQSRHTCLQPEKLCFAQSDSWELSNFIQEPPSLSNPLILQIRTLRLREGKRIAPVTKHSKPSFKHSLL